MMRHIERTALDRRGTYLAIGAVLGLGAPAGWWLLESLFSVTRFSLYLYLTVSTTAVFALFGYALGGLISKTRMLADSDSLTGLLNQTTFFRIAEAHFELARRRGDDAALIVIDLDEFKSINDQNNHLFGSFVIAEVGRILTEVCRKADVVARFGGDEFMVFLPSTDQGGAVKLAQRLHQEIRTQTFSQPPFSTRLTASVGVSHLRCTQKSTLRELVEAADAMVYRAKRAGRDQVASQSIADTAA